MFVVFDTNAYRGLVSRQSLDSIMELSLSLRSAERDKGIVAMMGSIPAMEILSHLLDDKCSRSYNSCLKAAVLMYNHCGDENQFNLLPSPQTQIAKEYFGLVNNSAITTQQSIGQILFQISKDPSESNINSLSEQLISIKKHVQESEQVLIDNIKEFCHQVDPSYENWKLFYNNQSMRDKYLNFVDSDLFKKTTALAMVQAVNIQLNQQGYNCSPTKEELNKMVNEYVHSYPASLEIRKAFWKQFLNPGFDLEANSRANYLWDEQILHFVGHTTQGQHLSLITSDKQMILAALKSDQRDDVMTLQEYLKYIGLETSISI